MGSNQWLRRLAVNIADDRNRLTDIIVYVSFSSPCSFLAALEDSSARLFGGKGSG